jgi:hypothetical protein
LTYEGRRELAHTYLAKKPPEDLLPYDWYLALVVAGALQHSLPQGTIDELAATARQDDPKPERESKLEALRVLREAGFGTPADVLAASTAR